jgi:hypothetical protein
MREALACPLRRIEQERDKRHLKQQLPTTLRIVSSNELHPRQKKALPVVAEIGTKPQIDH